MHKAWYPRRIFDWVERGLLLAVAPFLLFPTLHPILTLASLGVLLFLLGGRWLLERVPTPVTPFNGALLLWEVALAVGIAVTAIPRLTLPKATCLILGLALWRHLVISLRTTRQVHWATVGYMGAGIALALLALFSIEWPSKVPVVKAITRYLPTGFITLPEGAEQGIDANQFAGVMALYFPLPLSLLFGWRPRRGRWAVVLGMGCVTAVITLLLLLTQSRSGWMGAVGGGLTLLLLWIGVSPSGSHERRILYLLLGLSLVVVVGGAFWIGPERLRALWREPPRITAVGPMNTLLFRKEVWRWAWVAVWDFAFTGCGLGTFREVVRLLYPLNITPGYDIAHAHNMLLQTALDTGIPGLVAYLALLGIALVTGWRIAASRFTRPSYLRAFSLGLAAGLVGLHVYGITDALATGSKPSVLIWLALGLLQGIGGSPTSENGYNRPLADSET